MILKSVMRTKNYLLPLATCVLLLTASLPAYAGHALSNEAEVRAVVERVFEQLKSGQYGELYDVLPAATRARMPRERFNNMLQRTRNAYELDRMEIGAAHVSGSLAVVETVLYGRVLRPIENEGKIVVQQYLVREEGGWRVATGDRATIRRFLAANPRFARSFQLREPRIYIKRDGRWIDAGTMRAARPRA